mmetsp:Transcript_25443/g.35470  ORF Transcript_25443/g.35470 Transcript_25443/m.35470 type:complete len:206 (+) Transcript_25443:132-749(+)
MVTRTPSIARLNLRSMEGKEHMLFTKDTGSEFLSDPKVCCISTLVLKPSHTVFPCVSLVISEVLSAMEDSVVIKQHNVTRLHCDFMEVLASDVIYVLDIRRRNDRKISKVDVCTSDFDETVWSSIAQVTSMVVDIAEPERVTSNWMTIQRGLLRFKAPESRNSFVIIKNEELKLVLIHQVRRRPRHILCETFETLCQQIARQHVC